MFLDSLPVLLVDDEPDVLSISKLAMKNFKVMGLPLTIYTAASKAEAIDLLHTTLANKQTRLGVYAAFIDVIMETDTAGLELCHYIRKDMGNKHLQLFIRTGQPGLVPERLVIDRYDINGYISKIDATEDRIYTMVKNGASQAFSSSFSLTLDMLLHKLIKAADSQEKIVQALDQFLTAAAIENGQEESEGLAVLIVDGKVIGGSLGAEVDPLAAAAKLDQLDGIPLNEGDDKFIYTSNMFMVKVTPEGADQPLIFLGRAHMVPPDVIVPVWHQFVGSLAALWQRTGARATA